MKPSRTLAILATAVPVAVALAAVPATAGGQPENLGTHRRQGADLVLTKRHLGDLVAGARATYVIDVVNAGPGPSGGVTVTDTLPAGTSFVAGGGPGWTCSAAPPVVGCANGGGVSVSARKTTLANPVAASDTEIAVVDASGFKKGDLIDVDGEIMEVADDPDTTVTPHTIKVKRGRRVSGSDPKAHAKGRPVQPLNPLGMLIVTVLVGPTTGGLVTNTATVAGAAPDPDPTSNRAVDSAMVMARRPSRPSRPPR